MSVLFTKEVVTRSNLASWLYSKLTNAGWTMISSKTSTDSYVFYSKSETNDMDLYMCINADAFAAGTNVFIDWYPCMSYTPGAAGVAGTFISKQGASYSPALTNTVGSADRQYTVYYSINKDRAALVVTVPLVQGALPSGVKLRCCSWMLYMGLPDRRTMCNPDSKTNSGNFLWVANPAVASYQLPMAYFFTPSSGLVSPTFGGQQYQCWYTNNMPYATGGSVPIIPYAVTSGGTDYGFLDGIYMPPQSILMPEGDIIKIGVEQFRVCRAQDQYQTTSYQFCIRVA